MTNPLRGLSYVARLHKQQKERASVMEKCKSCFKEVSRTSLANLCNECVAGFKEFRDNANPIRTESDTAQEKFIIISNGEGSYASVVDDIREGLHKFMCLCGNLLDACNDESTLEMLKEMEDDDDWSFDEGGRRHQYCFQGYCYSVTVTMLRGSR